MTTLRSRAWFEGDDEVALIHRVAMRNVGIEISSSHGKPVIAIMNSASDLNPCNLPLDSYVHDIRAGVREAGGVAVELPVMSLGEDLMKPSAMLYRNLLSMEVEEYVRTYPIDGLVLLGNCDKSVPGAVMGAISADVPFVLVTAGAKPVAMFEGRPIGTGTDTWRAWEDHRAGRMDDERWQEYERCLACGLGACNTMGTTSTMSVLCEVLGVSLPGSAAIPTGDPRRLVVARDSGQRAVELVLKGSHPLDSLTAAGFRNAVRALHAVGGSTNAIIHLLAMAGRSSVDLTLDDMDALGRGVPVIADIEPSGRLLMQDFDVAGGVPALMRALDSVMEMDSLTVTGRPWSVEAAESVAFGGALVNPATPLHADGSFRVVHGNLAPHGAVIKISAASSRLLHHTGPAVVFHGYEDMRARIDDPALDVTADSVLVLVNAGPVAVPGMPEWGMIPIPARLAAAGVEDMVRVTDARMSGTSFGACVLHAAPEAAVGGPLSLVRDGDRITLDVAGGRVTLHVDDETLNERELARAPFTSPHLRGWPALYQQHVLQADLGCDLDFLRAPSPESRRVVPPVIGRS
jgi:dihydroxy-acid dehydratase